MKAIALHELIQNLDDETRLLEALFKEVEVLRSPARVRVEAVLLEQLGLAAVLKRRWEKLAEEMDYPAGASA